MEALTRRQAEILQMIRAVVERDGRPPTRAEIALSRPPQIPASNHSAQETHFSA